MSEKLTIEISREDLGQIADALEVRVSQWRNTLRYHASEEGEQDEISVPIEECTDQDEAATMLEVYQRILGNIYTELGKHG